MDIQTDTLKSPNLRALVEEHRAEMGANDNAAISQALDLKSLEGKDMTFFTVWEGETLTGCAALREIDDTHGEIKSMHTARRFRRRGVSAALLFHLTKIAKERGYKRLSLETHPGDGYEPARKLYERFGFEKCPPFGDYEAREDYVFMTKAI